MGVTMKDVESKLSDKSSECNYHNVDIEKHANLQKPKRFIIYAIVERWQTKDSLTNYEQRELEVLIHRQGTNQ